MKVYVIHGPNMNMLGIREPDIYGRQTYDDLVEYIRARCEENGMEPEFFCAPPGKVILASNAPPLPSAQTRL